MTSAFSRFASDRERTLVEFGAQATVLDRQRQEVGDGHQEIQVALARNTAGERRLSRTSTPTRVPLVVERNGDRALRLA